MLRSRSHTVHENNQEAASVHDGMTLILSFTSKNFVDLATGEHEALAKCLCQRRIASQVGRQPRDDSGRGGMGETGERQSRVVAR